MRLGHISHPFNKIDVGGMKSKTSEALITSLLGVPGGNDMLATASDPGITSSCSVSVTQSHFNFKHIRAT